MTAVEPQLDSEKDTMPLPSPPIGPSEGGFGDTTRTAAVGCAPVALRLRPGCAPGAPRVRPGCAPSMVEPSVELLTRL